MSAAVKIGDTLFAPTMRGRISAEEFIVTGIGRKWITLKYGGRCMINSLLLDCGGYSTRKLYRSEADYEAECNLRDVWRLFCADVSLIRLPCDCEISIDKIQQAREILGLNRKLKL